MRYAWANPRFRRMMNWLMFSWEWTKGAWAAGGGEVLETAFGGGHYTTPEMRAFILGRWARMYGTIMIGVPIAFQLAIKAVATLLGGYEGDDDDPWFAFSNEEKHGPTAYNITPLLKVLAKSELLLAAKQVPVLGTLLPVYTGTDKYNTTGNRKYYQHFGKQGWEEFRWFEDPVTQFLTKLSMPLQRLTEGILGYNPASREFDLPFSKMSLGERWINLSTDGALFNMLRTFVPFSWNALSTYGDAGILPALGPVSMGTSYRAALLDAQSALTSWALNDRTGYSSGYSRSRKNPKLLVGRIQNILNDAILNGMDPHTILTQATGLAAKELYKRLFELLPKRADAEVDVREIAKVARGLNRLGITMTTAMQSLKAKFGLRGMRWERMAPEHRIRVRSILSESMRDPFTVSEGSIDARYKRGLALRAATMNSRRDY